MVYQLLPLLLLIAIVIGTIKIFSKSDKSQQSQPFRWYNQKVLIACIILSLLSSMSSLGQGAYIILMAFIISMISWYLLISICRLIVRKFSK